ncbi:hypothetical protein Tdes44962_MAKER06935 [Teratosphaeria destructans]|uniref:Uncharacterized protein n=1 Tax=Teratosphaeria destructans TaxID=418781 RepID=A0A9W7W6G6_9PEZI|nr:hypothetical protein Tdes44962_MAKER06935 [Teratosphaeria destructans]
MKTSILIMASGLAGAFADMLACYDKSAEVVNAIANFCSTDNLTIPSIYANAGFRSSGNAFVSVDGHCDPPNQVSEDTCLDRFYTVCAGGNANGTGTNNCTLWAIYNDNGPVNTIGSMAKRAASAVSKARAAISSAKAAADAVSTSTDTARVHASSVQQSVAYARSSGKNAAHHQQHPRPSNQARDEKQKRKADHEV